MSYIRIYIRRINLNKVNFLRKITCKPQNVLNMFFIVCLQQYKTNENGFNFCAKKKIISPILFLSFFGLFYFEIIMLMTCSYVFISNFICCVLQIVKSFFINKIQYSRFGDVGVCVLYILYLLHQSYHCKPLLQFSRYGQQQQPDVIGQKHISGNR